VAFGMAIYGTADKLGALPEADNLGGVAGLVGIGLALAVAVAAGLFWRARRAAGNRKVGKLAALPSGGRR